jgi:hypothetical protein
MKRYIAAIITGVYLISLVQIVRASEDGKTIPKTNTAIENVKQKASKPLETDKSIKIEVVTEDELNRTAGVLPGAILYKLERAIEKLRLAVAKNEEKLAALKAEYALERAAEAAVLTEKGKTKKAERAVEEYIEAIASASEHLNAALEANREAVATMEQLTETFVSSKQILQVVLNKASESARASVEDALSNQDGMISAIQGFHSAKKAFLKARVEFEATKNELKAAIESGDEEAIKISEVKVALAEVYKDEMEILKDSAEASKEKLKALVEEAEHIVSKAFKSSQEAVNELEVSSEK